MQEEESPVPAGTLSNYGLVFDAVYTPVWTRLLLDAKAQGCQVIAVPFLWHCYSFFLRIEVTHASVQRVTLKTYNP